MRSAFARSKKSVIGIGNSPSFFFAAPGSGQMRLSASPANPPGIQKRPPCHKHRGRQKNAVPPQFTAPLQAPPQRAQTCPAGITASSRRSLGSPQHGPVFSAQLTEGIPPAQPSALHHPAALCTAFGTGLLVSGHRRSFLI